MTWPGKISLRDPPDWRCRCGARNAGTDRGCEGCGAARQTRRGARVARPALSIAPPPTYAEPTPEDRAHAKAALATIRAGLAKKPSKEPSR